MEKWNSLQAVRVRIAEQIQNIYYKMSKGKRHIKQVLIWNRNKKTLSKWIFKKSLKHKNERKSSIRIIAVEDI